MGLRESVSKRLRLNEATPIPTALVGGGGAAFIWAARQLPPPDNDPLLFVVWVSLLVSGVVLFAFGVVALASMAVRSGRFVRAFGSRLRFRSPVVVIPDPGTVGALLAESEERGTETSGARPTHGLDPDRLRRALDIAITWLYRRENWKGLSSDGKYSEPAPHDTWAGAKYRQLGLEDVHYAPPPEVPAEKGWSPPPDDPAGASVDAPLGTLGNHPRPPKAQKVPEAAWEHARPDFCARLVTLIDLADQLTKELQAVPVSATTQDSHRFGPKVEAFVREVAKLLDDFYDPAVAVAWGKGQSALGPIWRQRNVRTITSRRDWLEAERVKYGCAETPPESV